MNQKLTLKTILTVPEFYEIYEKIKSAERTARENKLYCDE